MNHTVFTDGHVRVIGFRGAVPYKIGLFPAVYHYQFHDKEHYAIGEAFERQRSWSCRSTHRMIELTKRGGITPFLDRMQVDTSVSVLCVTEETDAIISDVLPNWRASHAMLRVFHEPARRAHRPVPREPAAFQKHWEQPRHPLWFVPYPDPPAWAMLLPPDEAEELAITTVISLQTVMDDCLLDNSNEESVLLAEELGWIAWELLSIRQSRARRDTMTRIVAARSLQPQRVDFTEFARIVAKSLGLPSALSIVDLAMDYLQRGEKIAFKTP